jgi:hypothetical protein
MYFQSTKLPRGTEHNSIINGSYIFCIKTILFETAIQGDQEQETWGSITFTATLFIGSKPIMLKWCNKSQNIGNAAMVNTFMEIYFPILHIIWNNILTALSATHVTENTHLADIHPNIRTTYLSVLYQYDVLQVKPLTFMGNQHFFWLFSHTTTLPFCSRF